MGSFLEGLIRVWRGWFLKCYGMLLGQARSYSSELVIMTINKDCLVLRLPNANIMGTKNII